MAAVPPNLKRIDKVDKNDKVDDKDAESKTEEEKPAPLGEDDEFEDFPVDDWPDDQTEAAQRNGETKHLWEESWDDDDTTDDFSAQLKEELKRVEAAKRR